jgi:hypothetical protein
MHKVVCEALVGIAFTAWAFTADAQATDPALELAYMPSTMSVTLLKHSPEGGTCRRAKGALIMRVGPRASPETTRVRYASAQVSAGGCPFLTMFDLPNADYAVGRAAFLKMENDASKKVDEIKRELGEKWTEIFGKKD